MKKCRLKVVMMCVFMLSVVSGYGQNLATKIKSSVVPLNLGITHNKTTNLIFPFSIKSIDRGSRDLLAQQAKGVENILQIKAANDRFLETNLTVVTADAALYSFLISYNANPRLSELNVVLGLADAQQQPIGILPSNSDNEARIITSCAEIALKKAEIKNAVHRKYDIALKLAGLYIENDILFFQIELDNNSNVPYDIEQLRLFVQDRKKSARTSSQELEVSPVYIHHPIQRINANTKNTVVLAIPKFTIPDKKMLLVQLHEKNGGRNLQLTFGNKRIVRASVK